MLTFPVLPFLLPDPWVTLQCLGLAVLSHSRPLWWQQGFVLGPLPVDYTQLNQTVCWQQGFLLSPLPADYTQLNQTVCWQQGSVLGPLLAGCTQLKALCFAHFRLTIHSSSRPSCWQQGSVSGWLYTAQPHPRGGNKGLCLVHFWLAVHSSTTPLWWQPGSVLCPHLADYHTQLKRHGMDGC